jgi:hypothetical protein
MVRLKRLPEMSVLKNVTIRVEGSPETEVWVAILKTAVSFNSLNPFYDGFYYKNEIIINNMDRNQSVSPSPPKSTPSLPSTSSSPPSSSP